MKRLPILLANSTPLQTALWQFKRHTDKCLYSNPFLCPLYSYLLWASRQSCFSLIFGTPPSAISLAPPWALSSLNQHHLRYAPFEAGPSAAHTCFGACRQGRTQYLWVMGSPSACPRAVTKYPSSSTSMRWPLILTIVPPRCQSARITNKSLRGPHSVEMRREKNGSSIFELRINCQYEK